MKSLVKKEENLPATIDMLSLAGSGLETVSEKDLVRASLKIAQALSKSMQPDSPSYIEGMKLGNIYVTGSTGFSESVNIVPVKYEKKELEWDSDDKLVDVHNVDNAPKIVETTEDYKRITESGTVLVETNVFHCLLIDPETFAFQEVFVDMAKTNSKIARQWLTNLYNRRMNADDGRQFMPPIFSSVWELSSKSETNKNRTWYNWNVKHLFDLDGGNANHIPILTNAIEMRNK